MTLSSEKSSSVPRAAELIAVILTWGWSRGKAKDYAVCGSLENALKSQGEMAVFPDYKLIPN